MAPDTGQAGGRRGRRHLSRVAGAAATARTLRRLARRGSLSARLRMDLRTLRPTPPHLSRGRPGRGRHRRHRAGRYGSRDPPVNTVNRRPRPRTRPRSDRTTQLPKAARGGRTARRLPPALRSTPRAIPASPSSSSSSATPTASPTPRRSRSPSCPARPTTRSSSTARPGSARPTCCTRRQLRHRVRRRARRSATRPPRSSRTSSSPRCAARSLEHFKARFRDVDVLLIDDVQFLERKARTEEEFFHTFNALYDAGSQLVITCDRLPRRPRRRSRTACASASTPGSSPTSSAPDLATRLAILRKRGRPRRHRASRRRGPRARSPRASPTNVRALEGALIRVVAFASLTRPPARRATSPTRSSTASASTRRPRPAAHRRRHPGRGLRALRLTPDELLSRSRADRVVWPRQVAMYLAKRADGASRFHDRTRSSAAATTRRSSTPAVASLSTSRASRRQRAARRRADHCTALAGTVLTGPLAHLPAPPQHTSPLACEHSAHLSTSSTAPTTATRNVRGDPMKLSLSTATSSLNELQTVTRVASTRSAVQALSGVQLHAGEDGRCRAARHRHGGRPARSRLEATCRAPRRRRPARPPAPRRRPRAARARRLARAAARRAGRRARLRGRDLPPAHAAQRGLPAICRDRRRDGRVTLDAAAFVGHDRPRRRARPRGTRPGRSSPASSCRRPSRELRMVATDSYRLSVKRRRSSAPVAGRSRPTCRPARSQELARIVQQSRDAETITISVSENQIVFELDGAVLSSRLIDGQFPNYQLAASRERSSTSCAVDRAELADVVRRDQPARAEERAAAARASPRASCSSRRRRRTSARRARRCRSPFHGRAVRDRLQPRVPARRARERRRRRRSSSSSSARCAPG